MLICITTTTTSFIDRVISTYGQSFHGPWICVICNIRLLFNISSACYTLGFTNCTVVSIYDIALCAWTRRITKQYWLNIFRKYTRRTLIFFMYFVFKYRVSKIIMRTKFHSIFPIISTYISFIYLCNFILLLRFLREFRRKYN